MKQCSKCEKWKPENAFGKRRRLKDGLSYWCKNCLREYGRRHNKTDGRPLKKYYRYEECHRVVDGVKQRRCRRCRKWKPESEFYKKRKHKDGLAVYCKQCTDKATNDCRRRRLTARN